MADGNPPPLPPGRTKPWTDLELQVLGSQGGGPKSWDITAPDGAKYRVQGDNPQGAMEALHHYLSVKSAPDLGSGNAFAGNLISGIPLVGPAIKGGVDRAVAGIKSLTGGPDYSEALEQQLAASEKTEGVHPTASTLGKVTGGVLGYGAAGAIAPGLMGLDAAAPMATRIIAGAASNAAIGGADTAVRGGSPSEVAMSVATGGGLGAVAAPLGQAIGAAARPVGRWIGGMFAPAPKGMARPAAAALTDAIMTDSAVKSVPQRLRELGPEGRLIDAGPTLRGWGQGVAAAPGDNRTLILNALKSREAGATGRIGRDVDAALGPARNPYEATADIAGQRTQAHGALPSIFAAAPPVDTSGVLATIGKGLTKAVGPERSALLKLREWLVDPIKGGGAQPVRDAERLNNAKMAIDTLINYGDATLGVAPGALAKTQGMLSVARKQLNDALRDQVPGYSGVMDQSSGLAKEMEAIDRGVKTVTGGDPALKENFGADFAGMSPEEQDAARLGMRSGVNRVLRTNANDRVGLRRAIGGEGDWNRENLTTAFGSGPTDRLLNTADREATFAETNQKVGYNSETGPRLAAERMANPDITGKLPGAALSFGSGGIPGVAAYGSAKGIGKVLAATKAASLEARNRQVAHALVSPHARKIAEALIKRAGVVDKGGKIAEKVGVVVQAMLGYDASMRKGKEILPPVLAAWQLAHSAVPGLPF